MALWTSQDCSCEARLGVLVTGGSLSEHIQHTDKEESTMGIPEISSQSPSIIKRSGLLLRFILCDRPVVPVVVPRIVDNFSCLNGFYSVRTVGLRRTLVGVSASTARMHAMLEYHS